MPRPPRLDIERHFAKVSFEPRHGKDADAILVIDDGAEGENRHDQERPADGDRDRSVRLTGIALAALGAVVALSHSLPYVISGIGPYVVN